MYKFVVVIYQLDEKGKRVTQNERLVICCHWVTLTFILYCNRTSLVLLTGSFLLLIQLVYNNNKLVHKLKTTLMKICMNRNFYHLSFSSTLDRVSAASQVMAGSCWPHDTTHSPILYVTTGSLWRLLLVLGHGNFEAPRWLQCGN